MAAETELDEIEQRQSSRLVIVLAMIGVFFVVELVGAKIARSDVLEADAFHLLMDVFAIGISLGAMRLAKRAPNPRYTFGLRRVEPIAALANGVLVLGVAVELVRDATEHLGERSQPRTELMLLVATAALVVNGLSAWLLHGAMHHGHGHGHHHHHHHHHHDHDHEAHGAIEHGPQLNLRGAWLHLLGDALGSFAAFVAGLAIRLGASSIADPIASFVVVVILVVGALRLIRDAVRVLLEAAPAHLPVSKVEHALLAIDGVKKVHALHVWSLGTGHDAITAHVQSTTSDPGLSARVCEALRTKFLVEYVTIQVDVDA
jgi:cobalt-zinc-cadmium efflux system protein